WSQSAQTEYRLPNGLAIDSDGYLFAVGYSDPSRAFLTKYDSSGNHLWTRYSNRPGDDAASDLALDNLGNIYIAGVDYRLGVDENEYDSHVYKYGPSGDLVWSRNIITAYDDAIGAIAV